MSQLTYQYLRLAIFAFAPLFTISSCGLKKHPKDEASEIDESAKSWWISKANNSLRLGQPMADLGSMEDLKKLPANEIAAKLASDPAFYDMMADFGSYWMGTKANKSPNNEISEDLANQGQVVNAVKVMASGGDFFAGLFQEKGLQVISNSANPYIDRALDTDEDMTQEQRYKVRHEIQRRLQLELPFFVQLLKDGKTAEFCEGWKKRTKFDLGGPRTDIFGPDGDYLRFDSFAYTATRECQSDGTINKDNPIKISPEVLSGLIYANSKLDSVVTFIDRWETRLNGRKPRAVQHVVDLDLLDTSELDGKKESELYSGRFFFKLQNSSTNRNRRRASWVLKRFFCDDLTPINIDAPSSHVGGQHGSDPACQSCHYKLDPMAGYFRELGIVGSSFAEADFIIFDDQARAQRTDFEKPWKAPASAGREWNIGYIRSTTDDSQNTFGSNFYDLLELLKTAPEVKECFVRRAFEYMVGEEQAYDKAWGRTLVAKMNETAKTNANLAVKQVFIDIATSKAFATRERNNNTCYDFAGDKQNDRAPCRIAAILERNCTSCHSANNRQGGLDLSSWKMLADNKPGFPHKSGDKEITNSETLQNILERLSATDSSERMPLMRTMPASEREELYLWLQKELDKNKSEK